MQYAVEQQPEVIGILCQEYLQAAIAFRFASSAVARARAAQNYLSLVLASFHVEVLIGGDAAEQHRIAAR